MIARKYCLSLLGLIIAAAGIAQDTSSFTTQNGKWTFALFKDGITRGRFIHLNYSFGEQVSNAVIVKPVLFTNAYKYFAIDLPAGTIDFYHGADTVLLLNYFDSAGNKGFRFRLREGEQIFGAGERSVPLNRRGYKLDLYNSPHYGYGTNTENLNYSIPFIISSRGYGIFFDNPSKGYLDIGKANPAVLEYGASSGELSFYIIPGNTVAEIVSKFQALVGTQPIPARWVFGNLMSRFGYRSQNQLLTTVQKMKSDNFPVDAVILDLFWFGDSIKHTLGNLDWVNKGKWPQPGIMIKNLKKQGIRTILITEPYVLNTTGNYEVSKKFQAVDSAGTPFVLTNFYFGNGGLLDIFRKDAQDWFWSKYKPQIAMGVAGWWGDLGEPETHPATMNHNLKDLGFKRLFKADEVHNIYGHYWDKMLFDKYAKEYPAVRLFNLNRSGYAGSNRYCIFPWSGDVGRNWDGLTAQLPIMLSMSMCGIPYIHADAGGFGGGEVDEELYTRWLQFASFTPVFRPHGTALGDADPNAKDIASEPCFHPGPYKDIVRRYINMRYTLLPYNYTLAYEEATQGKPLVRPLFYNDNTDSNLMNAGDEYYWGDNIIVAPVLEKGSHTRKLYLPKGQWYSFSGQTTPGGTWLEQPVDSTIMPVYIKEGSFIPMADFSGLQKINNTADYSDRKLTVEYFPSPKITSYDLFLDDGITSHTIESRNYVLLHFEGSTSDQGILVSLSALGKPAIKNVQRLIKLMVPAGIAKATINHKAVAINHGRIFRDVPFVMPSQYVLVKFSGKPVSIVLQTK
jgi:oligosaccharide 4-alpha-D-glucosyltransferase